MRLVFSKRARRQFETAAAWWREYRDAAPYLFEDEVLAAVQLLSETPFAGAPSRDVRMENVRRLVLQQTRYILYYRVSEDGGVVELLRVWHSSRRQPK